MTFFFGEASEKREEGSGRALIHHTGGMLTSIRCRTCLAPIEQNWCAYESMRAQGIPPGEILDSLRMTKICCRKFFITNVSDLADVVVMLNEEDESSSKNTTGHGMEEHATVKDIRSCNLVH